MSDGAAARFRRAAVWLGAAALAALLAVPLARAWTLAPDLGHGWAAPLLMGYLWWERWGERPALRPRAPTPPWWIAGVALAAAALPLRLLLTPFPLWPTLVWAYAVLLVGFALAAAGLLAGRPGIRWLGGPLVILAAALPWGSLLEQHFIFPLREAMAAITAEVSNLLGRPALAEGTSVRLANGWVGVDEACGGIRSLEAAIMLALFFGEWLRFSWKRRLALVGAGIVAAVLGNFLRILFLSLRAAAGTAAFFAAHDAAGWLALAFSLTLTGLLARRWAKADGKPRAARTAGPARISAPPGRAAAGWILAVAALLVADEAGTRWWYARGAATFATVPQWTVALPQELPSFRVAGLSEESRDMLVPDRYVAGTWTAGPDAGVSAYYIEWKKGQVARFVPFLHNPTVCLPLAGCTLEKTLDDVVVPGPTGDMPFHAYIFRCEGQELAVAFVVWDSARGRPLEKETENSAGWSAWLRGRWADVRGAREDQPAQMLSVAISGPEAETRLSAILAHLMVRF